MLLFSDRATTIRWRNRPVAITNGNSGSVIIISSDAARAWSKDVKEARVMFTANRQIATQVMQALENKLRPWIMFC